MKKPVPNHAVHRLRYDRPFRVAGVLLGLVMFLNGGPNATLAATVVGQSAKSGGLTITSDRMELDDKQQSAVFIGDVRAEEKRILLTADKMTVNYHKGPRTQAQKTGNRAGVATIRAEGRVVLVQGDNRGTAEEMIYLVDKQTLEMLGHRQNAVIQHGADQLEGKRIFLTIGDDHTISRISVQGGEQRRVSARITPTEEADDRPELRRAPPRPALQPGRPAARPVDDQ
ncbi:MAG: hypothetical protein H7838_06990 [Magnetococcus sp. DMHC-8]